VSLADDPTIIPVRTPPPSDLDTITEDGAPPIDAGPLPRGATVGRYVIIDELGAGAMGRVYAAFDPRLDRKVALKLIRSQHVFGSRSDRGAARLLAEAQALARLAHPNVVGVHDVEIVDGSVAIAMEFVAGTTVRGWLATPRSWREIVAVLASAGSGLAAAHRAGIIHRDFKPDNVMIGDDGRARVVDFGLARADAPSSDADEARVSLGGVATATPLDTATHGIAGTPAYMAPELYGSGSADARSDQFSFCVALYEALYGRRPFEGNSPATMLINVVAGRILAPEGREVPAWVHRVIVRGLAARPEQRHASMDDLLAALARDPSERRRRIVVVGAAVAVFAGGVAATWRAARPDDPCDSNGAELAGIWDDEVREHVADALVATGVAWAENARVEVERRLDEFAAAWIEMSQDNCAATHVRHEQSDAMLDLRTACLGARRRELAATTKVLSSADADVARESVRILGALGSIEACADLDGLRQDVAPPDDPEVRARVDTLRAELAEIDVETRAGRFSEAHRRAAAIRGAVDEVGYPPLVAEAEYMLGYTQDKIGDSAAAESTLANAALLAERHRHDVIAARALADAAYVIGAQLGRVDDGLVWSRFASAAAHRTGDALLVAKAENIRGMVLRTGGRLDEAEQALREGLALRERLLGARHIDVSGSLSNLAVNLEAQGRDAEALDAYARARSIDEDLLGPDHPRVAGTLNNSVTALLHLGRNAEALAAARRAEEISRATLPDDHPSLAAVLGNLSVAMSANGDRVGARAVAQRQLELNRRRFGDEHPDVAIAHHNLGTLEYDLGEFAEARRSFERAIAIYGALYGPDHPEIAGSLSALGEVEQHAGEHGRARVHFTRAIEILHGAGLDARIELPIAWLSLAESILAMGDLPAAEAAARRAIALFSAQPQWAARRSMAQWLAGRIVLAIGGRGDEAVQLARAAIAGCPGGEHDCAAYAERIAETFGATAR
jgi:tetratricopeptide (TPR) repeat protein